MKSFKQHWIAKWLGHDLDEYQVNFSGIRIINNRLFVDAFAKELFIPFASVEEIRFIPNITSWLFNFGTVIIRTADEVIELKYVENPREFVSSIIKDHG